MRNDVLFLTLNVFSATGGIEKVCRIAGKALYERSVEKQERLMIWSMHDKVGDADGNVYFPSELYKCFGARKASFVQKAVRQGAASKIVVLSHINLLMVAWAVKKLSPGTRIILMAHGIEIWGKISAAKTRMLGAVDEFWAVSRYTAERIKESHGVKDEKIKVLNNSLDPFLPLPKNIGLPAELYQRYGIGDGEKILFTLTRLSSKEKYKGYEDVITALQELNNPAIKYILAGRADDAELGVVKEKINKAGLTDRVVLAGFIPEAELAAHFKMSDGYIMPSSKEGFGIVFIEAMYYGLPVIGGNADGTMDALRNGELGLMVTPGNVGEIKTAIEKLLSHKDEYVKDNDSILRQFGYDVYKQKLGSLLN